MQELVQSLWSLLNISFTFLGFTFTFWNVIEAGIVLYIMGFAFGKIILFTENRR